MGSRDSSGSEFSVIYVDYNAVYPDAQAKRIGNFAGDVFGTLARTLISNTRGYVVPKKQGFGLFGHNIEEGWPIVRPRLVVSTPLTTAEPTRRYLAYPTEGFNHDAFWSGPEIVAYSLRKPVLNFRLPKPRWVGEVMPEYVLMGIIEPTRPSYKGNLIEFPKAASSYRLAQEIARIGNEIVRRECAAQEINSDLVPTIALSGLRLETDRNGHIHATPCEPSL